MNLKRRPLSGPFLWGLIAVAAGLSGCGHSDGPPLASVSGVVRLDGSPLANAYIEFTPQQGSPSYAKTDAEGRYSLRFTRRKAGAMIGQHRVRISTASDDDGEGNAVPEKIPPQFNSRTRLQREVAEGENAFDFELTSTVSSQTAGRRF